MKKPVEKVGRRFVLERPIGSGGMAVVFLGRDEVLGREVAVKILRSDFDDPDVGSRFEREGRTAAGLSHPNIVQVYDAGKDESESGRSVSYIVMEYAPGGDLKELMDREGPLSERELSAVGAGVAAGLAHAHARGVVHRDIKPQNVLLDGDCGAKLTDFGIARALDGTARMTSTGSYLGTALYSSPEQLQGEKVTPKSDVYSLGVTLYEAATGEPLFSGTPMEVAGQQLVRKPVPPRALGAKVSPRLEAVILSCLAKDPNERPPAQKLRTELLETQAPEPASEGSHAGLGRERLARRPNSGSGEDRAVNLPARTFRPGVGRARALALLGALLVIALLALGAYGLLSPARNSAGQGSSGNSPAGSHSGKGTSSGGGSGKSSGSGGGRASGEGSARVGFGNLTRGEAANTVGNAYLDIVVGRNYKASYGYLSKGYKSRAYPSSEVWARKLGTLKALRFVQGPTVELSRDKKAKVMGVVQIIYTQTPDGTTPGTLEQARGTWTLVPENGRWKLDDIQLQPEQTQSF